jgi:Cu+-exporting ATPase
MQVRKADAPARAEHAGTTHYFCSDRCLQKFQTAPEKYADGRASEPMEVTSGTGRDPVCGMTVDLAAPGARATVDGVDYVFCCQGCADAFVADPQRYLSASAEGRS